MKPFPPGPRGLQLSKVIYRRFRDPVRQMQKLHGEYGDWVGIRLGKMHQILLNDPAGIRQILIEKQNLYPKGLGYQLLEQLLGQGLLNSEGELWRQQRKIIQPTMHRDRLQTYATTMQKVIDLEVDCLRKKCALDAREFDGQAWFTDLSLKVICQTILGIDSAADVALVKETVHEVFQFIEDSQTAAHRFLDILPQKGLGFVRKRLQASRARKTDQIQSRLSDFNSLIEKILKERESQMGDGRDDFVSLILNSGITPRKQIRDELVTMLVAGYETTATTLHRMALLLGEYPHFQEKISADDLGAVDSLIYETLRLYPSIWRLSRFASQADEIGGYHVPQGTLVVISLYGLHRDPRRWGEDADQFKPLRFYGNTLYADKVRDGEFLPFGLGPRMCMGAQFAMIEMRLALQSFLRNFRWRNKEAFPLQFQPWITLRPNQSTMMELRAHL